MVPFREARQVTGRTLEEIEALAAEATPGPWGFLKHDCKELPSIDSFEITFQNKYGTAWLQSSNTHGVTMDRDMSRKETAANAALLASARDLLAIAQGQREEMARLKRLVKMALLEGVAIGMHREDLTEPWENGERAWNGSKASEEVNMAIGTKK